MSRERNEEKKGLSPTQRKACVVLALCALAVVMSILARSFNTPPFSEYLGQHIGLMVIS